MLALALVLTLSAVSSTRAAYTLFSSARSPLRPAGDSEASLEYDASARVLVHWGGRATFAFDAAAGVYTLLDGTYPAPLRQHASVFVPALGSVLSVGGTSDGIQESAAAVVFNASARAWQTASASFAPVRAGCVAFDGEQVRSRGCTRRR